MKYISRLRILLFPVWVILFFPLMALLGSKKTNEIGDFITEETI